jgi:chromosome partitioning protein
MYGCSIIHMKTIAILSQKGGAGKTTLALHLAVASEQDRKVAVILDLDPQASATLWKDSRQDEKPAVISLQASRLENVLNTARKEGAERVFIDTAPHSESASLAAARVADLILIPCRPAILDLRAIRHTIDLARIAQKPVFVVLNSVSHRGNSAQDAQEAVESYQVPIAPVLLGQRAAFVNALTLGKVAQEYETKGKASEEIQQLYVWMNQQIG